MLWLYRRLIRQRQSEPALVMGRFEARRFSAEAKFGARLDWKPALAGAGSRSLRAERPLQSAGHCRPRVCWIRNRRLSYLRLARRHRPGLYPSRLPVHGLM